MLNQIISSLRNQIRTMIQRFGVDTVYPVRTGEYPRVGGSFIGASVTQVDSDGKAKASTADIEVLSPYGLAASLPLTAKSGIKFNITGDSCNRMGIAYDPSTLPNLEIGEVAVGAFSAAIPTYLKFTQQGTIEVWKQGILVIPDLITHKHTGVTAGSDLSGPPSPI